MKQCPNESRVKKKVEDKKMRDHILKPERKQIAPMKKKK